MYWLSANSSGLNLIEPHFAVLKHTALDNTDYRTPDQIEQGLQAGLRYLNTHPTTSKWTNCSETYVMNH